MKKCNKKRKFSSNYSDLATHVISNKESNESVLSNNAKKPTSETTSNELTQTPLKVFPMLIEKQSELHKLIPSDNEYNLLIIKV